MLRLKVKEIAEQQGFTLAGLARKADIDQRTLRSIYREPTKEVSTTIISKLAAALNMSPLDLLEVVDEDQ